MPPKRALSELEEAVMNVVWSRGGVKAADVQAALAPDRPLKDSTIRTILTRLEQKGYVRHKVDGRTFLYSGIEKPRNVAVRAVKEILDRFCNGSVESLLVGMVDGEIVDPEELQRIATGLAHEQERKSRALQKGKK